MLTGRKGFVNGVYIVAVYGYPKIRFFFYSAREAEKKYRADYGLKYKRIEWTQALY